MVALREADKIDQGMNWESARAAAAEGEAAIARGDYVELRSDKALKAHLDGVMARVQADAEHGRRKQ
jgi:hypothetical protein